MDGIYLFKIVLHVIETDADRDTFEENRATVLDYRCFVNSHSSRERFVAYSKAMKRAGSS
jgi:hypothetical protein